jgi:hypothetical protein
VELASVGKLVAGHHPARDRLVDLRIESGSNDRYDDRHRDLLSGVAMRNIVNPGVQECIVRQRDLTVLAKTFFATLERSVVQARP